MSIEDLRKEYNEVTLKLREPMKLAKDIEALWNNLLKHKKKEEIFMFPDRRDEIIFHRKNAYKFLEEKNYDMARMSFMKWVESVRQQNINTDGQLEEDLNKVKKEYSDFVKNDPLYISICNQIVPKIEEYPGILQTDLYKVFPNINRSEISYALYFAAEHNKIKRVKKGRTYSLYL